MRIEKKIFSFPDAWNIWHEQQCLECMFIGGKDSLKENFDTYCKLLYFCQYQYFRQIKKKKKKKKPFRQYVNSTHEDK